MTARKSENQNPVPDEDANQDDVKPSREKVAGIKYVTNQMNLMYVQSASVAIFEAHSLMKDAFGPDGEASVESHLILGEAYACLTAAGKLLSDLRATFPAARIPEAISLTGFLSKLNDMVSDAVSTGHSNEDHEGEDTPRVPQWTEVSVPSIYGEPSKFGRVEEYDETADQYYIHFHADGTHHWMDRADFIVLN